MIINFYTLMIRSML